MKKLLIAFTVVLFSSALSFAGGIEGKWKTIDDGTGEVKSIVEIKTIDGKLYGTILQLFNEDPNYDPLCDECKDDKHNQKIIGMQIINGLTKDGSKWVGDDGILDPDNGKYYDVKIWVDADDSTILHVRGYIAFLYRTQTWHREK